MASTRSTRYPSPALNVASMRKRRAPGSTRASTIRSLTAPEPDVIIASSELIEKFAMLADRLKLLDPLDEEQGLSILYERICNERLSQLKVEAAAGMDAAGYGDIEYQLLVLERNTWDLCQRLFLQRNKISQDDMDNDFVDHPFIPPKTLIETALYTDSSFAEIKIVRDWLQDINAPFEPIEIRRGGLFFTGRVIKGTIATGYSDKTNQSVVTELDPDAPSRQAKTLHPDDDAYEKIMVECLFNYIRNGRFDEAIDLCEQTEYFWRSATLRGSILYDDPLFGKGTDSDINTRVHGNKSRSLWKKMCRQLASDPGLYSYDRALYGSLSGDVENVLNVCESWEDHVWAYYSAYFEDKLERILQSREKTEGVELPRATPFDLSPEIIFEQVAKIDKKPVRNASSDPFHTAQMRIILNQPRDLISDLNKNLDILADSPAGSVNSIIYPILLRFAVHFILLCRSLNLLLPEDDANSIIDMFVNFLTKSNTSLVAQYTSYLPPKMQVNAYAKFLSTINDEKSIRYSYLKQAQRYDLDIVAIARLTVDLIINEALHREQIKLDDQKVIGGLIDMNAPISNEDTIQIRALEWLTYRRDLYPFACVQSNSLLRRFLVKGKVNAAQQVHLQLPHDVVNRDQFINSFDRDFADPMSPHYREILQLKELLTNLKLFVQWKSIFYKKPTSGSLENWKGMVINTTEQLYASLVDQLSLDFLDECMLDGNLSSLNENEKQRQLEFRIIRKMFVPELVFAAYTILFETRDMLPDNLEKCMKLFSLVADSRNKIYKEFMGGNNNDKLKLLLSYVQRASLVMLEPEK